MGATKERGRKKEQNKKPASQSHKVSGINHSPMPYSKQRSHPASLFRNTPNLGLFAMTSTNVPLFVPLPQPPIITQIPLPPSELKGRAAYFQLWSSHPLPSNNAHSRGLQPSLLHARPPMQQKCWAFPLPHPTISPCSMSSSSNSSNRCSIFVWSGVCAMKCVVLHQSCQV